MARPDLTYLRNLIVALTGVFCGTLTGLAAAAGSAFSTPLVRYLLGTRASRAPALATTFFAALTAITTYTHHHKVSWSAGIVLAVAQIIGVSLTNRRMPALRATAGFRIFWSIAGIATGLAIIGCAAKLAGLSRTPLPVEFLHSGIGAFVWIMIVGVVAGAISQIMDLGGVLIVPACLVLLRLDPSTSLGTAMVGLLVVSMSGLLIFGKTGELQVEPVLWISLGALFGGLVGAYVAVVQLSPSMLVTVFGVVLSLVALGRFLSATGRGRRPNAGVAEP